MRIEEMVKAYKALYPEELVKRYKRGERNFEGVNLLRAELPEEAASKYCSPWTINADEQ